jgi:hypothetical protein
VLAAFGLSADSHSGCLQPLDYLLDFRQARLNGKELAADAVQLLRKDFTLAASG